MATHCHSYYSDPSGVFTHLVYIHVFPVSVYVEDCTNTQNSHQEGCEVGRGSIAGYMVGLHLQVTVRVSLPMYIRAVVSLSSAVVSRASPP